MDVATADRDVVDVVGRVAVAGQHALDGDLGVLAPLPADAPQAVVEVQLDRRPADRLALARAVEDDVLHRLAAQRRRLRFAEHPAHGVDHVGLAAAVRADDADELTGRADGRGIDERLEAGKLDLREAQGKCFARKKADGALGLVPFSYVVRWPGAVVDAVWCGCVPGHAPLVGRGVAIRGRPRRARESSNKRRIIAESPRASAADQATATRSSRGGRRPSSTAWHATSHRRARGQQRGTFGAATLVGAADSAGGTCIRTADRADWAPRPPRRCAPCPVISRSGTASSSMRVYGCSGRGEELAAWARSRRCVRGTSRPRDRRCGGRPRGCAR